LIVKLRGWKLPEAGEAVRGEAVLDVKVQIVLRLDVGALNSLK
jgi:hypothetical protein